MSGRPSESKKLLDEKIKELGAIHERVQKLKPEIKDLRFYVQILKKRCLERDQTPLSNYSSNSFFDDIANNTVNKTHVNASVDNESLIKTDLSNMDSFDKFLQNDFSDNSSLWTQLDEQENMLKRVFYFIIILFILIFFVK